jgi:hypothetical protein
VTVAELRRWLTDVPDGWDDYPVVFPAGHVLDGDPGRRVVRLERAVVQDAGGTGRMTELEFIYRVLVAVADAEAYGDLWWRTDGDYAPVTFFVNCNDLFAWACGDVERVTPENVGEFERAAADAYAADPEFGSIYAPALFCCRVRGMRPQGAAYPKDRPALWPLFDACGPERVVEFGNPKPHPARRAAPHVRTPRAFESAIRQEA